MAALGGRDTLTSHLSKTTSQARQTKMELEAEREALRAELKELQAEAVRQQEAASAHVAKLRADTRVCIFSCSDGTDEEYQGNSFF